MLPKHAIYQLIYVPIYTPQVIGATSTDGVCQSFSDLHHKHTPFFIPPQIPALFFLTVRFFRTLDTSKVTPERSPETKVFLPFLLVNSDLSHLEAYHQNYFIVSFGYNSAPNSAPCLKYILYLCSIKVLRKLRNTFLAAVRIQLFSGGCFWIAAIFYMEIYTQFQTPEIVCDLMASYLPDNAGIILEPTPGIGNLVSSLNKKGTVIAPMLFEAIPKNARFDYVVMNPPFTPMVLGYQYLSKCMNMSDNVIALLPWFIIINSAKRLKELMNYGLVSVTNLPRKTFPGTRIQCCILELKKGYSGKTEFKDFEF